MAEEENRDKENQDKKPSPQEPDSHPRTFVELLIRLFWNPPWKRRWVLFPGVIVAVVVLPVLNFVGKEKIRDVLEHVGIVRSAEISCWNKTLRPEDSHIAGLRVIKRATTLDLQDWNPASEDQLARGTPVSLAISRNRFTIERTDPNQGCFIHRMGTSSGIIPQVHCERCRKIELKNNSGQLREWDLVFDIASKPLGEPIEIVFNVDFWNSFQRPEQWWGGFRILHATEKAEFRLAFPESRRPRVDRLKYTYVKAASQSRQDIVPEPMDLDLSVRDGYVNRVTWIVKNPQPDRSYRIYWEW